MGSRIDLTGRRFGKLVALAPTEKRMDSGSVVWQCRCDCGRSVEIPARRLVQGRAQSCGCLSHSSRRDYTGKRFGRLTVLEYAGTAGSLGKAGRASFWKCRCDCGNELIVRQTELQNGGTQSCGCLQKERAAECLELLDGTSAVLLERSKQIRSDNKSGHTGVFLMKNGKWGAYINFKKKRYWLGRFSDFQDAVKARRRGEEMHDEFLAWYHSVYERQKPGRTEIKNSSCP